MNTSPAQARQVRIQRVIQDLWDELKPIEVRAGEIRDRLQKLYNEVERLKVEGEYYGRKS